MTSQVAVQIGRELLMTAMLLALPTIAISLVVGLTISVLQTITSIQEQTLSFAPRIIAVGIVIAATLPWSLKILISFAQRMLWYLANISQ